MQGKKAEVTPSLTLFLRKLKGLFASLTKRAECFGVSCNTFAGMGDDRAHLGENLNIQFIFAHPLMDRHILSSTQFSFKNRVVSPGGGDPLTTLRGPREKLG